MAIKIINAAPSHYRAKCGRCGCEFTYELSDVSGRYGMRIGEHVSCPGCSDDIPHRDQRVRGVWQ